ncbi:hypothetical protein ALC53_05033 [Atta colombica]|uniref:Uncharacterized protein n=1 Tax=Atta colombica TaxID=520822 RepID=A0A151I4M0_9HYME|nr:hypothetical protein ALC53_05033 [Atta colombica]
MRSLPPGIDSSAKGIHRLSLITHKAEHEANNGATGQYDTKLALDDGFNFVWTLCLYLQHFRLLGIRHLFRRIPLLSDDLACTCASAHVRVCYKLRLTGVVVVVTAKQADVDEKSGNFME